MEARTSLDKLREAWPSIKGFPASPDEPVERAWLPSDGKVLRMAALQQAVPRADADIIDAVAALFATLKADARGPAARPKNSHSPSSRAFVAAPGRLRMRQHGSQRDQASRI